jgi:hypothetical protein
VSNYLYWISTQTFSTKELDSNDNVMKGQTPIKINGPTATNSIDKNEIETKENDAIVQVISEI